MALDGILPSLLEAQMRGKEKPRSGKSVVVVVVVVGDDVG